jgi:hypothetical protein
VGWSWTSGAPPPTPASITGREDLVAQLSPACRPSPSYRIPSKPGTRRLQQRRAARRLPDSGRLVLIAPQKFPVVRSAPRSAPASAPGTRHAERCRGPCRDPLDAAGEAVRAAELVSYLGRTASIRDRSSGPLAHVGRAYWRAAREFGADMFHQRRSYSHCDCASSSWRRTSVLCWHATCRCWMARWTPELNPLPSHRHRKSNDDGCSTRGVMDRSLPRV